MKHFEDIVRNRHPIRIVVQEAYGNLKPALCHVSNQVRRETADPAYSTPVFRLENIVRTPNHRAEKVVDQFRRWASSMRPGELKGLPIFG